MGHYNFFLFILINFFKIVYKASFFLILFFFRLSITLIQLSHFSHVSFFVFYIRGKEIAAASAKDCRQSEINYIEGATHWVNQECPEQVNNCIREYLRA